MDGSESGGGVQVGVGVGAGVGEAQGEGGGPGEGPGGGLQVKVAGPAGQQWQQWRNIRQPSANAPPARHLFMTTRMLLAWLISTLYLYSFY